MPGLPVDEGASPPACIVQAAADYAIPARALVALRLALGPSRSPTVQPWSGTYPVSKAWRVQLSRLAGIPEPKLARDPCTSGRAAAYVLRYEINLAGGDFWTGVGRFPNSVPPGGARRTLELTNLIADASRRQGLDPWMVDAVIQTESAYQADARSDKGAIGLMQVLPATAARYGVSSVDQLRSPAVNIDVGTRILKDLTVTFNGDLTLILAAYNAGQGAVFRYGMQVPPYPETQSYVQKVTEHYGPTFARRVYEQSLLF